MAIEVMVILLLIKMKQDTFDGSNKQDTFDGNQDGRMMIMMLMVMTMKMGILMTLEMVLVMTIEMHIFFDNNRDGFGNDNRLVMTVKTVMVKISQVIIN